MNFDSSATDKVAHIVRLIMYYQSYEISIRY